MLKRSLALILLGEILVSFIDASCIQNNRTYEEGQTWHPILQPFGIWRCANCSCIDGEIKCVKKECPSVTCSLPKLPPGACCPICEDFDNIPPTVDPDRSSEAGNGGRGCEFDGRHYANGDVFSSNSTGLHKTMENQCVNCVCSSGRVLCKLKTCDIPRNCRKTVRTKDDCCPKCAETSKALLGASELVYSRNITDPDCQTIERVHRNGSEWRPDIGKNCITCTCLNGKIDCDKVNCRLERLLCSPEKHAQGKCCNKCIRSSSNSKRGKRRKRTCKSRNRKNRKKNGKRRRKNRKGRRKSRRRNKNRKQKSSSAINSPSPSTIPLTTTLPDIFKSSSPASPLSRDYFQRLCKPDDTDKVIYRHHKKHHGIYIAFDDLVSTNLEVLWWNVTKGKLSAMEVYKYPAESFRQNITEDVILGAASNSEIRTFKRRLKRQMDKCLKKNKCRAKVIKRAFFCFEIEKVRPNCRDGTS